MRCGRPLVRSFDRPRLRLFARLCALFCGRLCVLLCAVWLPAAGWAADIRVRGGAGVARVDGGVWSEVDAGLQISEGAFGVTLRAPLRVSVREPGVLRARDWDDRSEWLRLAPRLDWHPPVDPGRLSSLSLRIAPTAGATLGHGSLVRDYRSALLPDHFKSGVRLDLDRGAVGLQLIADDVTRFDLVGVRLFARPWSGYGRQTRRGRAMAPKRGALANLTVAISAVADRNAPLIAIRNADGRLQSDAAGRPRMTSAPLVLAGVDVGLPVALGAYQHLVPYVDANVASIDGGGGAGLHAGVWWAWRGRAAQLRIRYEARRSEGSYRPGWIDGFYELERTQLGAAGRTKAAAWLARAGEGRWGHLVQARGSTPAGWQLAGTWETWHRTAGDRPADTASARLRTPVWAGVQAHVAWALRPGVGQQSVAAAARWQSRGPWHAWCDVQRTWHADAGVYAMRLDAAFGIGARWAW